MSVGRHRIRFSKSVLLASLLATILLGLSRPLYAHQPVWLELGEDRKTISLDAKDVPLSTILETLRERLGIRVVVPDFNDRKVTVSVRETSLTSLIEEMIQPEERYWIVSERELVIPNRETSRSGLKSAEPGGRHRKGDSADAPQEGERQLPPGDIKLFVSDGSRGTMKLPRVLQETTSAPRPVAEQQRPEPSERYGLIRFRLIGDKITPISMVTLPGEYVYAERLRGEFVYVLRQEEEVIAVESFQDPRRIHSYYPKADRAHEVIESKTGEFAIAIPDTVLEKDAFTRVTVRVYKLTDTPPTQELSLETFTDFEKVLSEFYLVDGTELLKRFPNFGKRE